VTKNNFYTLSKFLSFSYFSSSTEPDDRRYRQSTGSTSSQPSSGFRWGKSAQLPTNRRWKTSYISFRRKLFAQRTCSQSWRFRILNKLRLPSFDSIIFNVNNFV